MRKIFTIAVLAMLCAIVSAQTTGQRSDRKIIEIKKFITLTQQQETAIRKAYDAYSDRNDSILYKVANAERAASLKRRSEMLFNQRLMNILTDAQKEQYYRVMAAPEVTEKTKARLDELTKTGEYTQTQLDSAKKAIYKQLMNEKLVYATEKYDYRKQKEGIDSLKKDQSQRQRSNRKIREIKKVITISPTQEAALREAYSKYQQEGDSILLKVKNAATATQLKYESDKAFHTVFMNALTETQRNKYITVTSTPEVMAKAQAKAGLLRETGNYTDEQLATATTSIFNYLMLEKVVYERDKYDYMKQKENIRLLKKLEPTDLKKANAQEKLKLQGASVQGKTQW